MRAPGIVLVAAVMCVLMGLALVFLNGQVPGLIWYGIPIALLGLILAGMWVRDRRRPPAPPDTPESLAANAPGKWYPVALLGIVVVQVVWLIVWSKR